MATKMNQTKRKKYGNLEVERGELTRRGRDGASRSARR